MSDAGNEITGVLITLIAYFSWRIGPVPGVSDQLIQVFSKGELYIFALLLCFILLWSVVHAAVFILNIIAAVIIWAHQSFIIDNEETRERIKIAYRKIHAAITVLRS